MSKRRGEILEHRRKVGALRERTERERGKAAKKARQRKQRSPQ